MSVLCKSPLQAAFVISPARLAALPEVPMIEELGVKPEAGTHAVAATSRMPVGAEGMDQGIVELLVTAIGKAEADPDFMGAIRKGEFDIATAKPEEVKAQIQSAAAEFNSVKEMQVLRQIV